MKRILCILLFVSLVLSLAACGKTPVPPTTLKAETDTQQPTEPPAPTQSPAPTEGPAPTQSSPPTETTGIQADPIRLLSLEKSLYSYYEWADDSDQTLVRSAHSSVTLGQEAAAEFPELAELLRQKATMQENAMLEEYDNLVSFAREELAADRDGFETNVSTLDVQVRRADSLVVSLLSDSYSHYGQIENYRVFHGSNYDTQSGRELMLSDVVTVNNDLAKAVETELQYAMWSAELYSETAVEDYFANTPYDSFSWTLDYAGVTFYFAPGDLSGDGMLTAMVPFAKYPELFNEKYMAAPEEYAVEIPMDLSFFTQLDDDDALEAISISGWYSEERGRYLNYGIYTDTDGQYCYEDCFESDLHPYYVKTADGNYLYLFCEDFQEGWRSMRLAVFGLNADGSVAKIGERNLSPAWLSDNRFIVPTDPGRLILDDGDQGLTQAAFAVAGNGMPE